MSNPLPDRMTFGERYGPAMEVTTREEAAEYFNLCVERAMRVNPKLSREEAQAMERSNIGYWTGYYGGETAHRVRQLYEFGHPIFGMTNPTTDEAFQAGCDMAAKEVQE